MLLKPIRLVVILVALASASLGAIAANIPAGPTHDEAKAERPAGGPSLSGVEDESLMTFSQQVITLVRSRDISRFVAAVTLSKAEVASFAGKSAPDGAPLPAEEAALWKRQQTAVRQAAGALLEDLARVGIDLGTAEISTHEVTAEHPDRVPEGPANSLHSRFLRLVLQVTSDRKSATGAPIAGNYVVMTEDALRVDGRWVLGGGKLYFTQLPSGLLTREREQNIESRAYIARVHALPRGAMVPDALLTRIDDGTTFSLLSERGNIVVLEFWATWCGPCQPRMAGLERLLAEHPDWVGKVEVLTVSVDTSRDVVRTHLLKHGWTKTVNLWAGPRGIKAEAAQKFAVAGVPTTYVLDRSGKVVAGGIAGTFDEVSAVAAQLQ